MIPEVKVTANMKEAYRLLIGSIGDDSHSVGTTLLTIAFREAGFFVKNIGIMNQLADFFNHANGFDVVFISCMNGHADLYLKDFPVKLRHFKQKNTAPHLWYLGGNLSVQESPEDVIRKYIKMGFDFVSARPVDCRLIMERLFKDLCRRKIKQRRVEDLAGLEMPPLLSSAVAEVHDRPMTDEAFLKTRNEVLESWTTGSGVRTADIVKNHACDHKNLHRLHRQHQQNGSFPLIQPRTGVAHTGDEVDLLLYLRENGLDISSIQLDAASRKKMYGKALTGVLRSEKGKTSFLNGYPVPVHGVEGIEEIVRAIDTPFQLRAGSPDHRLVYEIGLAGGASSLEGGFICYLFPYDKFTSPVESLEYWKYIDKLASRYHRHFNVIINREYFGPLTCCLIEPAIAICINIVQAILSAKSGVKCISVGLAEQGNRHQDIAAIWVLDKMTRWYLASYGFGEVTVTTVYHQYMAAFPTDVDKARDLILNSAITGALARATRMLTKTHVEAHHIPGKEDNADCLKLIRKGLPMAKEIVVDGVKLQAEMRLLEREVRALIQAVENLGDGSVARGTIRAFAEGILDIPFSPSPYNRNRLITARDKDGAIRFVNPDHFPFDEDIVDFHRKKIHDRMTAERTGRMFEILEKDLTRIWKNDYIKWPLDGHYLF